MMEEAAYGTLTSFVSYCETWLPDADSSIFAYELTSQLQKRFEDFGRDKFDRVLSEFSVQQEQFQNLVRHSRSWQESALNQLKWGLLTLHVDRLAQERLRAEDQAKDEDEESEADDAGREREQEQEQDEDAVGDEEGVLVALAGARNYIGELAAGFSYWEPILTSKPFAPVRRVWNAVSNRASITWSAIKTKIKKFSRFIGLAGVLRVLSAVMKRSSFINVLVRAFGTVFVAVLLLLVFLYPLYRILRNPFMVIRWFFRLFDIEIPIGQPRK